MATNRKSRTSAASTPDQAKTNTTPASMKPTLVAVMGGVRGQPAPTPALSTTPEPVGEMAPEPMPLFLRADAIRTQTVQCTIPGYEHISVTYRTNNKNKIARLLMDPEYQSSEERLYQLLLMFVMRIDGWNFVYGEENPELEGTPVPVPSKEHPESFGWLGDEADDLSLWILHHGYLKAKEQALGN